MISVFYRFPSIPALVLSLALLLCAGCSCFKSPVVATVEGEEITAAELQEEMQMERGKFDAALLSREEQFAEFRRQALEKLIQERILLSRARHLGISPTEGELAELERTRSGALAAREGDGAFSSHGVDPRAWERAQRHRLIITKLIEQEVAGELPVSDAEVQAYYRQHPRDFQEPSQFRARQIIVDSKELADQIVASIEQGGDFGELAKLHSLSPDAKRGGDLGFFDSRSYPPAFTEICRSLKKGEVSQVVATDYGYQIFQLLDKRPARQVPLAEAEEEIRRWIREQRSEASFEAWFAALRDRAGVVIDETALKGVALGKAG